MKSFLLLNILTIASAADFSSDALSDLGAKRFCIKSTTTYTEQRCFYTYIPGCAGQNVPLVFDIHGYKGAPAIASRYTGWVDKADENCFVLVMPSGNIERPVTSGSDSGCFSLPAGLETDEGVPAAPCCCSTFRGYTDAEDTDDITFLRNVAVSAITDVVPQETSNMVSIDSKRIYMAGHSNGCISSLAMAAIHSDLVAAVCCHAGAAQTSFPFDYQPTPVWVAHGTGDRIINYNGMDMFNGRYHTFGARETHDVFAEANGCATETTIKINESGNTGTRYISKDCNKDATVELLALDDVGHSPYFGQGGITGAAVEVDTTQLAWDFCSQYSNEKEPELVLVEPDESSASTFGLSSKILQTGLLAVMWFLY